MISESQNLIRNKEINNFSDEMPLISVIIPTFKRDSSLIRAIKSIIGSNYARLEIIVVDMNNLSNECVLLLEKIEEATNVKITILKGNETMYVSGAINLALSHTCGDFILVCADDVVLEKNTIQNLVYVLTKNETIGIISPICHYLKDKKKIWWAGSKFNMWTSKTSFYGANFSLPNTEIFDNDTFTTIALIKKELFRNEKSDTLFFVDPNEFPIHYEEVDFSFRAKTKGWRVCVTKNAKVYHDVPTPDDVDILRVFGLHTSSRAYFSMRNKIIFHRKYSKLSQFLTFIFIFNFIFMLYYSNVILIKSKNPLIERIKILKGYITGFKAGLMWQPKNKLTLSDEYEF